MEWATELERPFTAKEINDAVFLTGGMKFPSPDGFNGIFYLKMWPIVDEKVTKFCLSVLNG